MNILVAGSLWPNEDRVLAFTRLGHRVVYAYVNWDRAIPLLEQHITCVPLARRSVLHQVKALVAQHEVDVVYSLLNSYDGSAAALLNLIDDRTLPPIVRHYKEHPARFNERERRTLTETAAQIYINQHSVEYFRGLYGVSEATAFVSDADMLAERYMTDDFTPKLRHEDGEPHVLIAGNLTKMGDRYDSRGFLAEMSRRRVHVHVYCRDNPTMRLYTELSERDPYLHTHSFVPRDRFTQEWSRYDVGLMHVGTSTGPFGRFERLNYPHRYTAYLAAGLPLAVMGEGHDAMRDLVRAEGIGLVYDGHDDLADQLHDEERLGRLTGDVVRKRKDFSFDRKAPAILEALESAAG